MFTEKLTQDIKEEQYKQSKKLLSETINEKVLMRLENFIEYKQKNYAVNNKN